MKRGLTFGELRQALRNAEEEMAYSERTSLPPYADLVHVFGMTLIQIAQELNEIKTILSRRPQTPPTLDELTDLIARAWPPGSAFTTHEPIQFTTSDGAVVVVNIIGPDPRVT